MKKVLLILLYCVSTLSLFAQYQGTDGYYDRGTWVYYYDDAHGEEV